MFEDSRGQSDPGVEQNITHEHPKNQIRSESFDDRNDPGGMNLECPNTDTAEERLRRKRGDRKVE